MRLGENGRPRGAAARPPSPTFFIERARYLERLRERSVKVGAHQLGTLRLKHISRRIGRGSSAQRSVTAESMAAIAAGRFTLRDVWGQGSNGRALTPQVIKQRIAGVIPIRSSQLPPLTAAGPVS